MALRLVTEVLFLLAAHVLCDQGELKFRRLSETPIALSV
jgi:hypothetical protein